MNATTPEIPLTNLAIAFIPALVALYLFYRWSQDVVRASWSVARMLVQLLLVGYLLAFIFGRADSLLVVAILVIMIGASSWIAVGSVKTSGQHYFLFALISTAVGGVLTLMLVVVGVLRLDPWYLPQFTIPLAGMIFSSAMNTISLSAERLEAELAHSNDFKTARGIAFNAALIPNVNAMFAVGLVSLPGMMTGQILAGVSPLIAVRYQIMVMCMIFGAASISAACFLTLVSRRHKQNLPEHSA